MSHMVTYEFVPVNGKPIQGEGKSWDPIRPDGKIQVTYLPDDPTDNMLTEEVSRTGEDLHTDITLAFSFLIVSVFVCFITTGSLTKKIDKDS